MRFHFRHSLKAAPARVAAKVFASGLPYEGRRYSCAPYGAASVVMVDKKTGAQFLVL